MSQFVQEFCLPLIEEAMEKFDQAQKAAGISGSPRERSTVHQRLDSDIDECFTAIEDLKSKLMPYLMEMPETVDIPLRDAPRTPLEATVLRVEVIREQIRDLVNRVVP